MRRSSLRRTSPVCRAIVQRIACLSLLLGGLIAPVRGADSQPRVDAAVDHPIAAPRPARSLSGPLGGLFLPGDYPALARRARDQGDVTVRLNIGTDGRVARCAILASNASRTLEMATCAVLSSRARLAPATDSRGSPVSDSIVQHIAWRLP